ncbi:hypothetical protein [Mycobacterium hubeiense]|uniref:hypothetical protein n=1 Tax=Mycobacterium hubeiense TaxID=1867256 RepID=UPI00115A9843|nr:hypothetical protein [Mycobacterium sp. QGD 101]
MPRSVPRIALTRAAGRLRARIAALAPFRDGIETYYGQRIHELMNEARDIAKNRTRAVAAA